MKIAFVSSGSSIHVKKIANYLVNQGHEITLYTMRDSTKLIADFDERVSVELLPFNGKCGYYLNARYLKKKLKEGRYDLINSHYASGYGTLSRLTGIHPIALAVFGADVYDYPFKKKGNMRRVIKNLDNADVITSTSYVMAEKVREFYKTDKEIHVTPFGVDTEIFKPLDRKDKGYFEFGIVKKIEPKYGIDILIRAFAKLLSEIKDEDVRLAIYGRGTALTDCENLAKELGISKSVFFKGFISNEKVPEAFSEMDVACFPSVLDSESFGVAAVEAMACGIPVIASDASGFTEVVQDGITGIIVGKSNIDELKNAMLEMFRYTNEQRRKMGDAGVNRVKELYTFSDNMMTYEKAIRLATGK